MKPKHTIFITYSPSFSLGFLSSATAAHFTISAQCRNVYICATAVWMCQLKSQIQLQMVALIVIICGV